MALILQTKDREVLKLSCKGGSYPLRATKINKNDIQI